MQLRAYQTSAVAAVLEAFEESSSALIVQPTGTGKTVVFAHLIDGWSDGRIMVLAHRDELIRQAVDKITLITGEKPDIEMADERADTDMFRRSKVVVSSIQTLIAGKPPRMQRFNPRDFGLVVVDEAHHAVAESYSRVLAWFSQSKVLGVTATPDRGDERALGLVFKSAAFVYEITDAIKDGWLVPIQQHSVVVHDLDYSQARETAGDLNQADVAKVQQSEAVLQQMVSPIVDLSAGRKTIVFATPGDSKATGVADGFKIAERMTEIFNRHRPQSARRVHQDTPKEERRAMLRDFRDGRFQTLVNVGVLTEGFDEPGIEVVAITRPTKSRALFAQMIGRGTRPLPGLVDPLTLADARRAAIACSPKPHLTVLDFEGNAGKHKLIHAADVLGGNYEDAVVARATAAAKKAGGDVMEHLERARVEIEQERRKPVVGKATYSTEEISPFDVLDIAQPVSRGWDLTTGPTERQAAMLRAHGVTVHEQMTRRQASAIIGKIRERQDKGLVNFKYAKMLRERGLDADMSVGEAMNALMRGKATVTA